MAKEKTKTLIVTDEMTTNLILEMRDAEAQKKFWTEAYEDLRSKVTAIAMAHYGIKEESNYRGIVNLETPEVVVTLGFDVDDKVRMDEADYFLQEHGLKPSRLFSVEYKYNATKFKSIANDWDEETKQDFADIFAHKRKKTSCKLANIYTGN